MTNGRVSTQHSIQGVFVFVLLGVFAVLSTLIVLFGAQFYRNTVDQSAANNDCRVLNQYVRSMVRAEDADASMSVEEFDGVTALAMREMIDDEEYITWIYAYDGKLMELFTSMEDEFDPEAGSEVCPVKEFNARIDGKTVIVHLVSAEDEESDVQVTLRCGQ